MLKRVPVQSAASTHLSFALQLWLVHCAEESTDRAYALKRMRKSAVVQCPEHVFCEQAITRNTAHPFCIRQYASFQDKYHLYFLFDLMSGGDLMDVLVAEAKVIKRRIPQGAWRRACLAPKVHKSDTFNTCLCIFLGSWEVVILYMALFGMVHICQRKQSGPAGGCATACDTLSDIQICISA